MTTYNEINSNINYSLINQNGDDFIIKDCDDNMINDRNELNTKTYIFDGKMKDINSYDKVYRELYKQYIKDAPIDV